MPEEMRPLMSTMQHLFRNSLDHGIESPAKRGGKPSVSTIELSLTESDSQYTITYRDDGRGIDEAAVKRRALERGILAADIVNSLSGAQLHQLIFEPGFSTASSLSDVSGRGLGMSAVRQEAERLKALAPLAAVVDREGMDSRTRELLDETCFELLLCNGFSSKDAVAASSGRGIGLAAARNVITGLRGSFCMTHRVGKGLTFQMSLPF